MSTPDARLMVINEAQAAAIWIAHCRLKASAAQNVAEYGDDEGDADWAEILLDLTVAYQAAPADPAEAANISLGEYFDSPPGTPHYVQCKGAAAAVLAALGCSPHPRNEDTDA